MTKRITITIDPLANVSIDAEGFKGSDCTEATKALEKAVAGPGGIDVREFKGEHQATGSKREVRQTTRMG